MSKRAENLLNHTEHDWLVDAIREAEKHTSGEIRVHLEDSTTDDVFDRAAEVFAALNMQDTRHRNGVLIYVEVCQHNFVVLGDMAFHKVVNDGFWDKMCTHLKHFFSEERYFEGLAKVVHEVGDQLEQHFPIGDDDNPNELPDSISIG